MSDSNLYRVMKISAKDVLESEHLGTKTKFWVRFGEGEEAEEWLYKIPRENTGEHWAEKVAYEVANIIGVPAAIVELADFKGTLGSCSKSFINEKKKPELIHGNEILAGRVHGYEKDKKYGQSDHTLDNINEAIEKSGNAVESKRALKHFGGYLVLDALIGNTDRHHENWAFLRWTDREKQTHHVIAPTFDHASSLGRELLDEKRALFIEEERIEDYIKKGKGAIFLDSDDKNGLNPFKLVTLANQEFPESVQPWVKKMEKVEKADFEHILRKIPNSFISEPARTFALKMLSVNLEKLKKIKS